MRVTVSAGQFVGAFCFVSSVLLAGGASGAGRGPAAVTTVPIARTVEASTAALDVRTLRPGLHLVQGAGGNVVMWSGTDGTVLVDTGLATRAPELFATVARVAPGPLRFVIDTHGHPDHTGGNAMAAERGAVVIGHEHLRDTEEAATPATTQPAAGAAVAADGRPILTLTDALALHLNGDRADVLHVANAHTNADLVVRWSTADVVALGDLYWSQQYPQIDVESGGSLAGVVAAVEAAIARSTARTIIVPGHGAPTSRTELAAYRDMLVAVGRRVREAVERGENLQQVLAAHPTAEFDARFGRPDAPASPEDFVRAVYTDLARRR
ncbi:MAG TPA: MBL fold metallo-hydrolase [Steroidobacteraceae bacterium]|nr:MBL fold metallo-hydrolase [Steroidobacteraceae bacterium]